MAAIYRISQFGGAALGPTYTTWIEEDSTTLTSELNIIRCTLYFIIVEVGCYVTWDVSVNAFGTGSKWNKFGSVRGWRAINRDPAQACLCGILASSIFLFDQSLRSSILSSRVLIPGLVREVSSRSWPPCKALWKAAGKLEVLNTGGTEAAESGGPDFWRMLQ